MSVQNSHKIGGSPLRREDHVLVRGRGVFTDDVKLTNPLHVAFVRSQIASGEIVELETEDALEAEGVAAVHTGADVADLGSLSVNPVLPIKHLPPFSVLAQATVRGLGQPVAAVLGETALQAADAAELVYAEIEPTESSPILVAEKNWSNAQYEEAAAKADHVVSCTIQHPRLAPSPMEPRSIAAAYDAETDCVTVWHSTQTPHRTRSELAAILGIEAKRIRVIAPHVGGAFGMKASLYPEDVFVVWAALKHKRDVKWTATRSEEFLSATHGRGIKSEGELALSSDGTFLGLKAMVEGPVGAWLPNSGLITAWNAARVLPSGYAVPAQDITTQAVMNNLGPTGIYRGAGRPEANCLMERLIDKAAAVSGIDPVELRRKNLIPATALPHNTLTGNTLDSGDYAKALDVLCEAVDYPALLAEQTRCRAEGQLVGIGIGFYLEPSGNGWETARVTLNEDGSVVVASGSSSQGHGRETAFAQIAADALNIDIDQISVLLADTAKTPEGIGALASRSTAIGGSAVLKACEEITSRLEASEALPITADVRYENKGQAWGYGAYLAQVSICRSTGELSVERITCVDDTGTIVNPKLVEGQILGGLAQGLGEALMESIVYDEDGQLLTGSFMDYAMPRAADIPTIDIHKFETPSPMNALGAKGVGEAGTIGAPAAILNAAVDALRPLGVTDLTMPLTSQSLWRAIRSAEQGKS
ncbi:xanthine dehydrogenase family protein molybdopterin-binding subunit [Rhodobacteraceae bacterium RKSG542]|uniref:xanthine dehydrogenase family protein molybdopterin-binding subunit n=1 Tax=Pseudovibrio flavus TaxID=2529854 RepID=UPI0012BB61B3|nr:xanthine dehydrogenase family protein molybdopterin-binding subunit [Pseudovibrio flavus]MTI17733.1 xanthine dehydrogenase family protein molybdopterin-binding subunit [Pseudovibrio flavus]